MEQKRVQGGGTTTYVVRYFLTRVPGSFNRERTAFSTNGIRITGHLHANE